VITAALDVSDRPSIDAALGAGIARYGGIDVLLNCAGTGLVGSIEESSDEEIEYVFRTNFFGTLRVIRTVLPHMRERRSGLIATTTSRGGLMGDPGTGIYCASKFALTGMCEALAAEVKPFGIDVSILEPGLVATNFRAHGITRAQRRMSDYEETCGYLREKIEQPFAPGTAQPREVALVILAALAKPIPPLHLPLGSKAVDQVNAKLQGVLDSIADWEDYARLNPPELIANA
jgi:NAD(P)-dependent dehydrogenase (short-subunit alcohol dehydrogenase family)